VRFPPCRLRPDDLLGIPGSAKASALETIMSRSRAPANGFDGNVAAVLHPARQIHGPQHKSVGTKRFPGLHSGQKVVDMTSLAVLGGKRQDASRRADRSALHGDVRRDLVRHSQRHRFRSPRSEVFGLLDPSGAGKIREVEIVVGLRSRIGERAASGAAISSVIARTSIGDCRRVLRVAMDRVVAGRGKPGSQETSPLTIRTGFCRSPSSIAAPASCARGGFR
jgi:hypothetical protein